MTTRDTNIIHAPLPAARAQANSNEAERIDARPFKRADYLSLKAATRRACEAAGSLADISSRTRVDPALISRYGNSINDTFIPLDVAMDLDALAGQPVLLRAWADLCGFELIEKDEMKNVRMPNLAAHLAPIAKEMSDVVGAIATARDTPNGALIVEREIAEARDRLDDADRDCRRVRAGER